MRALAIALTALLAAPYSHAGCGVDIAVYKAFFCVEWKAPPPRAVMRTHIYLNFEPFTDADKDAAAYKATTQGSASMWEGSPYLVGTPPGVTTGDSYDVYARVSFVDWAYRETLLSEQMTLRVTLDGSAQRVLDAPVLGRFYGVNTLKTVGQWPSPNPEDE